ncbi:MAG: antibiotic biosynthesis monooxygenase [Xanthobacteraceae bacterium]|nr:antibiotic biosynthesis monooxygenase [Xanthobacteraceae bacterium]QYK46357.1 MAG: antibiotic biosynthesis monooxygenase [Xanthobacteraceae bacterium]HMN51225.1 antibiotic biosynthesis monooxygenase [Xanthobacteraceae bacterium]
MYIAMNRFKVTKGQESEFERVWRERDSYLNTLPGFLEFHLLKGPEREDHTLYSSHTAWATKADFENWTKSDAFKIAHARANELKPAVPLYLGHPEFEGFESVLVQRMPGKAA